ncbi:hypothetical protein PP939_gp134 [Rhizobium phage RL38J1]|uniref:Uncharacterized protein n=1 Tax=Rhizobium phage RL38J1 TaxID=2663232 RepID=A0A6B9J322_9CAUD|nr:hypothetical protein PP939_gp134 [Rhizobium phage RL38J1]QGZ14073.1 hypothetical protein RL38J1_134 [Rhizobium phage RL38J1]
MAIYKVSMFREKDIALVFFFASLDSVWDSIEETWKELGQHERPVLRRKKKDSLRLLDRRRVRSPDR